MPVPNEITATDIGHIFSTVGGCAGEGSRYVKDGALTRVFPCHCEVCESGKAERMKAYAEFENKLAAARRAIDGIKSNRAHRIEVSNEI